jgi:predicted nucleotidyltransferase
VSRRARLEGRELEDYLERIARALVAGMSPERVVLFGSFARGDQNRASDVDLVVIAASELPFAERIGRALAACAGASRRVPVEALVYTPAEWQAMVASGNSFARLVEREGRVLYEREPQRGGSAPLAPAGAARP